MSSNDNLADCARIKKKPRLIDSTEVEQYQSTAIVGQLGLEWQVANTGDYDGDRDADILWRNLNTSDVRADLIENGQYQTTSTVEQLSGGWQLV